MTDRLDQVEGYKGPNLQQRDYAIDRTVLANERTYTAWIRTGLTALAAGVAVELQTFDGAGHVDWAEKFPAMRDAIGAFFSETIAQDPQSDP